MNRLPISGGWYCFATLEGDFGALITNAHIITSRGTKQLPSPRENTLYLVGATRDNDILMAGQSQLDGQCCFYKQGNWTKVGTTFGVSPCAFSQDGKYLYVVDSSFTGYYIDTDTMVKTPFNTPFFTDGIRAIVPPGNELILGNTTKYSPIYDLSEYIINNDLVSGQSDNPLGLVNVFNGNRYIIEPGGCYFNRQMYDGFNIAIGIAKQDENQSVLHWFNINEINQFPHETEEEIPVIGKPCYLTGFEFNDAPAPYMSGNGWLKVVQPNQTHNIYRQSDNNQIQLWVQGANVDEIEQRVRDSSYPAVAYWDGRNWPRWPVLRAQDYFAIQAYCKVDESISAFEANIRSLIHNAQTRYANIALVCQCYTSNNSLTTNLKGLVPVYARLARDYPTVNNLLVFSDKGRQTGLNDHPELVDYWQRLFNGITGEPNMAEPDYAAANTYGVNRWAELRVNEISQEMVNNGQDCRPFQQDCFVQIMQELHWNLNFKWVELFWKGGFGNIEGIGEDTFCARLGPGIIKYCDAVGHMGLPDSSWNSSVVDQNPDPPSDEAKCGPPPPLNIPANIEVQVRSYTNPTRRSAPDGCEIKFEIAADFPVDYIKISCNDGDLPFVWELVEGKDGRYFRIFGMKLTVPGNWTLRIDAEDNKGNSAFKEMPVTVVN